MEASLSTLQAAVDEVLDIDVTTLSDGEVHRGLLELLELRNVLDSAVLTLAGEWTNRGIWAEDGSRAAGARLAREANLRKGTAYNMVRWVMALRTCPRRRWRWPGKLTVEHVDLCLRRRRRTAARTSLPTRVASSASGRTAPLGRRQGRRDWEMPRRCHHRSRRRTRTTSARPPGHVHRGIEGEVHVDAIFDPVGDATFIEAWDASKPAPPCRRAQPRRPASKPHQRRLDALVELPSGRAPVGCPAAAAGSPW